MTIGTVRLRFVVNARANYSMTIQQDSQSYFAFAKCPIKVFAVDTCSGCKMNVKNGGIAVGARKDLAFITSFSPNPSLRVNSVTLRSGWAGS